MAAPSQGFIQIRGKMTDGPDPVPLLAKYKNKAGQVDANPRTLCPHVLGYKHKGKGFEIVLCWQLDDPNYPGPDYPAWRCFHVNRLTIDTQTQPQPTAGQWETPDSYSQMQSSVQHPVVKIPD